MTRPLSALLILAFLLSSPSYAWENEEYDACILQYQKSAKTNQAAVTIQLACDKLHKQGSFLLSNEKAYYQCLLKNIPGVENDYALQQIRRACKNQSDN